VSSSPRFGFQSHSTCGTTARGSRPTWTTSHCKNRQGGRVAGNSFAKNLPPRPIDTCCRPIDRHRTDSAPEAITHSSLRFNPSASMTGGLTPEPSAEQLDCVLLNLLSGAARFIPLVWLRQPPCCAPTPKTPARNTSKRPSRGGLKRWTVPPEIEREVPPPHHNRLPEIMAGECGSDDPPTRPPSLSLRGVMPPGRPPLFSKPGRRSAMR